MYVSVFVSGVWSSSKAKWELLHIGKVSLQSTGHASVHAKDLHAEVTPERVKRACIPHTSSWLLAAPPFLDPYNLKVKQPFSPPCVTSACNMGFFQRFFPPPTPLSSMSKEQFSSGRRWKEKRWNTPNVSALWLALSTSQGTLRLG